MKYYSNQIEIYSDKSIVSLTKAQRFALNNNIFIPNINTSNQLDNQIQKTTLLNPLEFEKSRIQTFNKIKKIDILLNAINENTSLDYLLYSSSSLPELGKGELSLSSGLQKKLQDIESKLLINRDIYKENDIRIKDLKIKHERLKKQLLNTIKGVLISKKEQLQKIFDASEKPEILVNEYYKLFREASKTQETLNQLENNFRILSLQKGESRTPWQLITKPTLSPDHVAPRISTFLVLSLFLGIIISFIICFINEKMKGVVTDISQIKDSLNIKLLAVLPILNDNIWDEIIDSLLRGKRLECIGNISILSTDNIDSKYIEKLSNIFSQSKKQFKFIDNLKDNKNDKNVVLLISIGSSKLDKLLYFRELLFLQDANIIGAILKMII